MKLLIVAILHSKLLAIIININICFVDDSSKYQFSWNALSVNSVLYIFQNRATYDKKYYYYILCRIQFAIYKIMSSLFKIFMLSQCSLKRKKQFMIIQGLSQKYLASAYIFMLEPSILWKIVNSVLRKDLEEYFQAARHSTTAQSATVHSCVSIAKTLSVVFHN